MASPRVEGDRDATGDDAGPFRRGHAEEAEFTTSGHTGDPVAWRRTHAQLRAEATLVADAAVGPAGSLDHIVNFAPIHHLYGHLFGEVLPRLWDVEVHQAWRDEVTAVPPLRGAARTLLVCLPSSWPLLRRLVPALRRLPSVVALHSSAAPTEAAGEVVRALDGTGFRAVSLLGSTETGAVAHRPVAPTGVEPGPWRLLPDVTLLPDPCPDAGGEGAHRLRVASPRLGRRADMAAPPASWRLADVVRPLGPREFDYLGRTSRLVKANGRRVWLDQVEAAVRAALPGVEAVCLPVSDPVRGEHYEVCLAAGSVPAGTGAREVRAAIGAALPGAPGPRAVHTVPELPRTTTGKIRIPALRDLLDHVRREADAAAGEALARA
ncbi:acyl-CoA synthetase [Streptomyces sp. 8K308]|uniref:AMP-binding protein n=1 Tax=Streptomyces sp. 8K308 TaxID=2530388 RepID=UPI001043BE06|nr:AMP-binding protein [Streptomyces sp. 8K308]TDC24537.1 acyl-CoA synthetase [Streptomyces sp. 8K308]